MCGYSIFILWRLCADSLLVMRCGINRDYIMDVNKIIQGDCLEVINGFLDKSVDLILTDPPYGAKRDKGFGG